MITNVHDSSSRKKPMVLIKTICADHDTTENKGNTQKRNNVLSMLSWDNLTSDTSKELKLVIDTFESMLQLDGIMHLYTRQRTRQCSIFKIDFSAINMRPTTYNYTS